MSFQDRELDGLRRFHDAPILPKFDIVTRMRNGRYLGTARRFLDAARRELTQGKIMRDDTALRQAAEKGWGAADV